MKTFLDAFLPRLFPGMVANEHFLCIQHEGKSDLDLSIPRKLKAWRIPNDRFVILRDNDNADCIKLKARFIEMCAKNGRPDTLIRLVCQELESWYIGDLAALAEAFEDAKLNTPSLKKRFSDPDSWQKPSVELERLIPTFQKVGGARVMGELVEVDRNTSTSFLSFVTGLRRLAEEMEFQP